MWMLLVVLRITGAGIRWCCTVVAFSSFHRKPLRSLLAPRCFVSVWHRAKHRQRGPQYVASASLPLPMERWQTGPE
uniref:Putative secreted protein n=1 Tax=Anopheles darlingi TaxID=43151 RepID=A0A2M4DQ34_ANODA